MTANNFRSFAAFVLFANSLNQLTRVTDTVCAYKPITKIYLFSLDNNVSVHKNITEQEKLAEFWLFTAHLGQHSLTNNDTTRYTQRLSQFIKTSIK